MAVGDRIPSRIKEQSPWWGSAESLNFVHFHTKEGLKVEDLSDSSPRVQNRLLLAAMTT